MTIKTKILLGITTIIILVAGLYSIGNAVTYLKARQGGTGQDSSAWTGPVYVTSGTWASANTTGSGTTIVMSNTPTLTTPEIGVATGTSLDLGGTSLFASRALTVDTGGVFDINMGSASGDDFTIDTSAFVVEGDTGKVGIGTSTPSENLHVSDSSGIAKIRIDASSDGYDALFQVFQNSANRGTVGYDDSDDIFTISAGALGLHHLNIDSSGDVGIGTTTPDEKLTVDTGNIQIEKGLSTANQELAYINFYETNVGRDLGRITVGSDAGGRDSGRMMFSTYDETNGLTEYMRITSTGNVGIGTTAPGSALTLGADDDVHITDGSICVENSGGTDCAGSTDGVVYADDYIEHSRSLPDKGLNIVLGMKNKEDGTLDHSSFPSYVSNVSNGVLTEGVSISSQIKYLIRAVQEQQEQINLLTPQGLEGLPDILTGIVDNLLVLEQDIAELDARISVLEGNPQAGLVKSEIAISAGLMGLIAAVALFLKKKFNINITKWFKEE